MEEKIPSILAFTIVNGLIALLCSWATSGIMSIWVEWESFWTPVKNAFLVGVTLGLVVGILWRGILEPLSLSHFLRSKFYRKVFVAIYLAIIMCVGSFVSLLTAHFNGLSLIDWPIWDILKNSN